MENKEKKEKKPEMSEEDKQYKQDIADMVKGLSDPDPEISANAFELIRKEITSATSSMTSIPKPLKFIRNHYDEIKEYYNAASNPKTKRKLGHLLAVLLMVTPNKEETILSYVLEHFNDEDITSWGQEFVRHLTENVGSEYEKRLEKGEKLDDLYQLVKVIVPFFIKNHSENEAVDILLDTEQLELLPELVNETNFKRICQYLLAYSNYAADTDEYKHVLETTYKVYTKLNQYTNALRTAMKLNNLSFIKETFFSCKDPIIQKQMAFMLTRQRVYLQNDEISQEIQEIISNLKLSGYYKRLARELELEEPKSPEDVIKSHLEEKRGDAKLESYKINTVLSMVNAFINAGLGTEKLFSTDPDWLIKNKEEGVVNLLAGLGLINIWDIENGPNVLEKYMSSNETDPHKRAGYNIGLGVCSSGIYDENYTAMGLLLEQFADKNLHVKVSSIFGIGLAYAGSQNDDLNDPLLKVLEDFSFGFEVSAFTSLTYGLVYLGSGNDEIIGNLISILIVRNEGGKINLMESPYLVLYLLGMGLLVLGMQKDADLMIEATQLEEFSPELRLFIKTLLTGCAYASTGNVMKVQEMMHLIAKTKEEVNPKVQSIAVIALSLIAIGEEIGSEMVLRSFDHFLQFGDVHIKKTVSLAIALLNLSNPKVTTTDSLLKYCYDTHKEVATNAIFSLGLVSAGTNHSRISAQMRQIASFHSEDTNLMFVTRIAQGLLYLGRGLMTLNPIHSNNLLVSNVGLAGLLISLFAFTESDALINGRHQFLLYSLCLTMNPRMAVLVDENLEVVHTQVMVGQAVDTTGQSGNPRTITGFQTHKAPVVLAYGERAELSTDEYIPNTDVLENIVIVRKNADFERNKK